MKPVIALFLFCMPLLLTACGDMYTADLEQQTEGITAGFFLATDGQAGQELWRTDGTASGTYRVRDINPGPDSARPINLFLHEDTLLFAGNDGVSGFELWCSDGTEQGTRLIKDINPGSGNSYPLFMVRCRGRADCRRRRGGKGALGKRWHRLWDNFVEGH
ncbi:MAG: hypothetical protein R2864_00075 [Syntrophotaleaceae bacterium]